MALGGKRFGAGRKEGSFAQHTIQAQAFKKLLIQRVIEQKEPLIKALIDRGMAGDVKALSLILERALGKVAEEIAIKGKILILDK